MNATPSVIFAAFIKSKRTEKDLSINKLANLSGVKRTTISMMETNKSGMSLENSLKLLTALNSSLGEFENHYNVISEPIRRV